MIVSRNLSNPFDCFKKFKESYWSKAGPFDCFTKSKESYWSKGAAAGPRELVAVNWGNNTFFRNNRKENRRWGQLEISRFDPVGSLPGELKLNEKVMFNQKSKGKVTMTPVTIFWRETN